MMLEFPHVKQVRHIVDQFMLGANILVAPVFGTQVTREVVLPGPAVWMSLWT